MDGSLILWGTLALSVFWSIGLYNRLMRMRAQGLRALGSVQKHMRVYLNLVRDEVAQGAASQAQKPLADLAGDPWADLQSGLGEFEAALEDVNATALPIEPLARLGRVFDAVQAAWGAVDSTPPDLAWPVVPVALRSQWNSTTQRVETARTGFNQIAAQYNEALDQFPASVVVGVMGFKPSGLL